MDRQWNDKIFSVTPAGSEALMLEIFRFQYRENKVYRRFADTVGKSPAGVSSPAEIPFLPIRFFKSHTVCSGDFIPEQIFKSSGTTGTERSVHFVRETGLYRQSFLKGFELFYGSPADWCILGLLPSYLEQGDSSLVFMVEELARQSHHPQSGFYLYDHNELKEVIQRNEANGTKTLLIGVTYALLDFAAAHRMSLKNTVIMETGGMKGRKAEITRQEVHDILKEAFALPAIHSEYGMTELLSQAYSKGEGVFFTPPWMKIMIREEDDPFTVHSDEGSGLLNIIDLANIYSCSFIATDDVGKLNRDRSFQVMGRADHADLRGCSLLVT